MSTKPKTEPISFGSVGESTKNRSDDIVQEPIGLVRLGFLPKPNQTGP